MSSKYHVFERGVPLNKELRDHVVVADDPLGAAIVFAVVAMGLYHASRESQYDVYDIKGEKTEVVLPSYVGPQFASSLKKAFHVEVVIESSLPVGSEGEPGQGVTSPGSGFSIQAGPGVAVLSGAAAQQALSNICAGKPPI